MEEILKTLRKLNDIKIRRDDDIAEYNSLLNRVKELLEYLSGNSHLLSFQYLICKVCNGFGVLSANSESYYIGKDGKCKVCNGLGKLI